MLNLGNGAHRLARFVLKKNHVQYFGQTDDTKGERVDLFLKLRYCLMILKQISFHCCGTS